MVDGVIILYDQNETSFTTNGLGYLPDATECIVTEELNGEFELQMEYPINGLRYKEIQHRRILLVKTNPYEDPQPFRIYNINKPIDGLVEINARHISYDLSGYAIPWIDDGEGRKSDIPFATGPASFMTNFPNLVNQLNSDMPQFTYWTNSTEDWPRDPDPAHDKENELKEPHWIFIDQPMNARNLIGQFTEKYKGEFKWDKFNVQFYGPISGQSEDDTRYRGKDSGVVLRYGKNLTDLMQEEDSDKGMYTHIYPYWSGSIEYTKPNGETGNKETVIELPEKLYPVFKDTTPNYKRIYVYDCTSDYTAELQSKDGQKHPSDETLKEMCDKLIKDNKLGTPNITLTASFVQLSKSVEYKDLALLEKILLGDTVTVYFPDLDVDSTLKCTSVEYNVLTDEYRTITLGEANTSVSNTIANTASMSSSNSTAIAGSATKNEVYSRTYDTALSTTSENAVQNKVVTKAINDTNDQITNVRGDISKIITQIEGLTPGTGSITYGYSLPTGGSDGDAYVKIRSEQVDPHATLSVSTNHNNFEISNFTRSGDKYSFDVSGTVDNSATCNYAIVNVDDLRVGGEYKVKFKMTHDIAQENLDLSYMPYPVEYSSKLFGLRVGTKDTVVDVSNVHFNFGPSREWHSKTITNIGPTRTATHNHGNIVGYYQQFYYDGTLDIEHDFYFTASDTDASFNLIFDDIVDGTECNLSVHDMEITYVGGAIIPPTYANLPLGFLTLNVTDTYNDNWVPQQGLSDININSFWSCWGGRDTTGGARYCVTFGEPQELDRIRINMTERDWGTHGKKTRTIFIEGSTDNKAWDAEDKEWINLTGHSSGEIIDSPNDTISHLFFDVDKGTYRNIRIRYYSPGDGILESINMYKRQEIENEIYIEDLYFKIDGKWKKYPRGEEGEVFVYGSDDPTSETLGDIYAKVKTDEQTEESSISDLFYNVGGNWLEGPSGGGGGGGGSGSDDYSTTETRIGTWIDGKPVYRVVIADDGAGPTSQLTSPIDVSSLNIESLVRLDAYGCDDATFNTKWMLNSITSNGGRIMYINNNNIIFTKARQEHYHAIIIEYTKTTD